VYTSTHDTETLAGAFPRRDQWELIELAMSSRAALCMLPLQDVLGLGNKARMNRPGRTKGNWSWRLEPGRLTDELARRLRDATERAGR
jgi:4-alpha-glucanotransferase